MAGGTGSAQVDTRLRADNRLTIVVHAVHVRGAADADLLGTATATGLPAAFAFVLLSRRSDGLYAAPPATVTSNLGVPSYPTWSWAYPLALSDGSDRFDADALTDGLLGVPTRTGTDYAAVRRRLGPRLATDPRPPEFLRVNIAQAGRLPWTWGVAWPSRPSRGRSSPTGSSRP